MANAKLKTKKAAAKRYRVIGDGRVKTGRKGKRHIFTGKSRKQKNNLRGSLILKDCDQPKAQSLLPYA